MSKLTEFVNELKNAYGAAIEFKESNYDEEMLSKVPEVLREFYKEYESLDTPFGYIYSIETLLNRLEDEPFKSEGWISFGFDGYFSFWLCKNEPNEENLSITYWDHEGGYDIDEPIYESVVDFLKDMQLEYEENREEYEEDWDDEEF